MPELPELQAHAERLSEAYAGAVLERFEPLSFTALKTFTPAPESAVGRPLDGVRRRGKHLLLGFGDLVFVVHLMQGGRLRLDPGQRGRRPSAGTGSDQVDPGQRGRRPSAGTGSDRVDTKVVRRPRDGVARWRFGGHPALLLTEAGTERRAGVWLVTGDPLAQPPLAKLGPEADQVDVARMASLLAEHSMRLHTFLREQRIVAGLGRRLANEICHRARLSPFAGTTKLGDAGAAAVVAAIRDAVAEGLAAERERDDMSASKERPGNVHARTGQPCPVCGDVVRAVEYRDYTVNYCATCQTGGKVLADNTTSKFLK